MITFGYRVGGWVRQNAHVIMYIQESPKKGFPEKDQINLRERLHEISFFFRCKFDH